MPRRPLPGDWRRCGAFFASASGSNYWTLTPHDGFYIGRHWYNATQILDGRVDEVAIYNRALTFSELSLHAEVGFAIPEPSSLILGGSGAVGLAIAAWRRKRAA